MPESAIPKDAREKLEPIIRRGIRMNQDLGARIDDRRVTLDRALATPVAELCLQLTRRGILKHSQESRTVYVVYKVSGVEEGVARWERTVRSANPESTVRSGRTNDGDSYASTKEAARQS